MNVVIATPFFPPERGVLGVYAEGIAEALRRRGDTVVVVQLGSAKKLPPLLRQLVYLFRVCAAARSATFVLALDTWSVGIPALLAAKLSRVPFLVRIGGDHLWETYVDRTHETVRLSEFYSQPRRLSLKERMIWRATRWLVRTADILFFNTTFQKKIWEDAYDFPHAKARVLENFFPPVTLISAKGMVFASGNRDRFYKNFAVLESAFARVQANHPEISLDTRLLSHAEHHARTRDAYAVIVPSISEVGSNNVIDGVAVGKPFIITDDTGTRERLADCGLFVDARDEEKVVAAIESLLDPAIYQKLTENIRAFSFTHSWDDIAREISDAV